jgi:hypothetical protein
MEQKLEPTPTSSGSTGSHTRVLGWLDADNGAVLHTTALPGPSPSLNYRGLMKAPAAYHSKADNLLQLCSNALPGYFVPSSPCSLGRRVDVESQGCWHVVALVVAEITGDARTGVSWESNTTRAPMRE